MTDTGQILPPPPKTSSGTNTPEQAPIAETEEIIIPTESVAIKKLALRLEKIIRETKLEGEIIRVDIQNKEIYIKTPKGEIVVSFITADNKTPPQISYGQTVTITLPVGEPPQTAELQILPIKEQIIEKPIEPIKTETPLPPTTTPSLKTGDKVIVIISNYQITDVPQTKTIPQKTEPDIAINIVTNLLPKIIEQPLKQIPISKLNNIPIPEINNIFAETIKIIPIVTEQISEPIKSKTLPNTTDFKHLENKIFQINIQSITYVDSPKPETNKIVPTTLNTPIITGTVTDFTPAGLPTVTIQTINTTNTQAITATEEPLLRPKTQIILQTPAPVAKGAIIEFTAKQITPEQYIEQLQAPSITTSASKILLPIPIQSMISPTWPALQEAIQISNEIAITATATALNNTIPSTSSPTKLIPTVMFFLAALRMGNIESWLGEKHLETLKQAGRKDIASRLSRDFGNISKQSQETISGDWRGISIPLLHSEDIKMIQLFTKQQSDGEQSDDNQNGGKTTRFIFNLKLSQMGDVQLDGFLRHKKTLDIFLRTNDNLPAEIKQNLLKAFSTGLKQAGLEGGQMVFQNNKKEYVHIETSKNTTTEITI